MRCSELGESRNSSRVSELRALSESRIGFCILLGGKESSRVMIGEMLLAIVEVIWDYLLPLRVVFCVTIALLVALSLSWLAMDRAFRIDILVLSVVVGRVAGIAWQSCHRRSMRETTTNQVTNR